MVGQDALPEDTQDCSVGADVRTGISGQKVSGLALVMNYSRLFVQQESPVPAPHSRCHCHSVQMEVLLLPPEVSESSQKCCLHSGLLLNCDFSFHFLVDVSRRTLAPYSVARSSTKSVRNAKPLWCKKRSVAGWSVRDTRRLYMA